MRRYRDRTMTLPPLAFTVREEDVEQAQAAWDAFVRNEPYSGESALLAWRADVERYARVHHKAVEWVAQPASPPGTWPPAGTIITWRLWG